MANIINNGAASLKNDLAEFYGLAQDRRAEGAEELRDIQLAVGVLTGLEAQRLRQKAGADDPRVIAYAERAASRLEVARALVAEAEFARVRTPLVAKEETLIHGRLADSGDRAMAGAQVKLVTAGGEEVPGAQAVTDDAGYYAIVLPPETAARYQNAQLSVVVGAGSQSVKPAAAGSVSLAQGGQVQQNVVLNKTEAGSVLGRIDFGAIVRPRGAAPRSSGGDEAASAPRAQSPVAETKSGAAKTGGRKSGGTRSKKKDQS